MRPILDADTGLGEIAQGFGAEPRAVGQSRLQRGEAGPLDQAALVIGQRVPAIPVDEEIEHGLGLVPAGHIDQLDLVLNTLPLVDGR